MYKAIRANGADKDEIVSCSPNGRIAHCSEYLSDGCDEN